MSVIVTVISQQFFADQQDIPKVMAEAGVTDQPTVTVYRILTTPDRFGVASVSFSEADHGRRARSCGKIGRMTRAAAPARAPVDRAVT